MAIIQKIPEEKSLDINNLDNDDLDANLSKTTQQPKTNDSLERVIELTKMMAKDISKALDKINTINRKTEFLAINALIEASRSGQTGERFQVVAESIDVLASKTKKAIETMRKETIPEMEDLGKVIKNQSHNIHGNKLSDIALTNIDIIDRNLYERTADVRWWATDAILVNALVEKTSEAYQQASKRLEIILKSYTVYADLVLLDIEGNAIANGKSIDFDLKGRNYYNKTWFQSAMKTSNGNEFGFEGVHKSSSSRLHTMTFSCRVHESGDVNRKCLGVLATIFSWDGLAQRIMTGTSLNTDENNTRVCIVDNEGTVLADTNNKILSEKISFPDMEELFKQKKAFKIVKQKGELQLICHAQAPGYEGYSTGWHSLIINNLSKD